MANTAGGDGRTAAQIVELQGQIDTLKAELAAQKNQIVGLQNALKTTSLKGFETAGRLTTLSQHYYAHDHFQNWLSVSNNAQTGGVNLQLSTMKVSPPGHTCALLPNGGGNKTWTQRYNCAPPQ